MRASLLLVVLVGCGAPAVEMGGTGAGSAGGVANGGEGGGAGGGSTSVGGFCAACIASSDCGPGSMCLGQPGHCAQDCAAGQACPSGTWCTSLNVGKMPLGRQCAPTASACDVTTHQALTCTDSWATWADDFIGTACGSCHRHAQGMDTAPDVLAQAQAIRLVVERGLMPPGAPLSAAEQQRLFTWLGCSAFSTPGGVH